MVATTQIHVLGLDIYGYGYDVNSTLAIRRSCSTSDIGLTPNVTQLAASDVADDPQVLTFSQNVQKVGAAPSAPQLFAHLKTKLYTPDKRTINP